MAAVTSTSSKGGGLGLGLASAFKLEITTGEATATDATNIDCPMLLGVCGGEFVPLTGGGGGESRGNAKVLLKFGSRKEERNAAAMAIELGVVSAQEPAPEPRLTATARVGSTSTAASSWDHHVRVPIPVAQSAEMRASALDARRHFSGYNEFGCTLESKHQIYGVQRYTFLSIASIPVYQR